MGNMALSFSISCFSASFNNTMTSMLIHDYRQLHKLTLIVPPDTGEHHEVFEVESFPLSSRSGRGLGSMESSVLLGRSQTKNLPVGGNSLISRGVNRKEEITGLLGQTGFWPNYIITINKDYVEKGKNLVGAS